MKRILHITFVIILLSFLSSCTSQQNRIDCPTFKNSSSKKFKNKFEIYEVKKLFKKKQATPNKLKYAKTINARLDTVEHFLTASTTNAAISSTEFSFKEGEAIVVKHKNSSTSYRKYNREKHHPISITKKNISNKRKAAITKGVSILSMAVIAGISIPVLGSLTASIGLVIILILDVLISLGVIKYYKEERPNLARFTGLTRLIYSGIFGIGIAHHIAGNLAVFHNYWSAGLIIFGIHLIALGILFHNEGGKKWVNYTIKSLLILAGIGYVLLNVGLFLIPNPVAFRAMIEPVFILPQVLGEVLFAIWMILKGGKGFKTV